MLSNTKVQVNAQNANGSTAFDVLFLGHRDVRDMAIKQSLQKAGALRNIDASAITYAELDTCGKTTSAGEPLTLPLASQKSSSNLPVKKNPKHIDWLGRKRSSLMVVASLIATIAFQAVISPPGGVWQDDHLVDSDGNPVDDPHKAGQSVMAYTSQANYGQFMVMNTIAYLSSLSIILLLVSGLPMKKRRWMWVQMVIMWIAITSLTGTAFVGLIYITPDEEKSIMYHLVRFSVVVWMPLMGMILFGHLFRMIRWFLRKRGYIKEKPEDDTAYEEEYEDEDEL